MAKKISSSDLFEQEDLFKGVRDSATKTLQVFNELQAELKATAQGLKSELTANTQASTAQLKQFTAATEQANTLMKQSLEIDELKAKATKTQAQADKELIRLQALKNKEAEKDAKNAARAAQLAEKEGSAYSKLSAELNKARKAYKDLAVTNQENTAEGKQLLATITQLDQQLKKVDATVGQHQRNVGNYEGATKSLKLQLRELTQALQQMDESDPRFQQMAADAGELRDRIQDTQAVVQATAGTAMENFAGATAKVGQIGVAAFQGLESSMQLLGVENENVLAGMAKLQALAGLADALQVFGGLGDTLTQIRAGFTAAATKMGLFTTSVEANTAAQLENEAVGAGGGAKADIATTIASTAATEADTVATMASTAATEADVAVTETSIAVGEADIATTVAGTTATVTDTAATVASTAASAASTAATEANVIATEAEIAATVADTTATTANTTATRAQVVATTGATTASKLLSTAMKMIPIVAIMAGVTALIANWDKLTAAFGKQTAAQKLSNQITTQAIGTIANELSAADKLQKQLKSETLTRAEKIQKVKEFQAAYPGLLQNMNLEAMSIDQINTQLTKNVELLRLQAEQKAIEAIRSDKLQQKLNKQLEYQKESIELTQGLNGALGGWAITLGDDAANGFIGFQTGAENAAAANGKFTDIVTSGTKAIDADIKALDAQSDANKVAIDDLMKKGAQSKETIKDYSKMTAGANINTGAINDNTEALERQRKELERINNINRLRREALDAIQQAQSEYQDSLLTDQQREINAVRDKYFTLIEDAEKYEEDVRILQLAQGKEILAIQKKYGQLEIDNAEWVRKNKEELAEKERQENIKLYEDSVTFEDKQNQAKLASLSGTQREEFEERLQFWGELEKLNKLKQEGAFASQEEYDKAVANLKKKYNKVEQKLEEEKWKTTQEFAQKTTDFFKQQSEKRISQMDKEIAAAEKQADYYRELAANGNINAQQSLAEQERIIAESNRRKEREQKRQQRMELANTIYQTYAGHAAKDPETALMKTIKDASLLQAFISTLPMFYDGTEDTGKGGGIDGKGGFHAVLHPHERVIPKSLNDQIGSLSNEQLTRLAMEYNNGRLVGQDVAHSSMDLAILVNKLDNLTEVIKHKPETNIELGEITQSAMEIVKSTRKGNTTVYNRFKVRS